MNEYTVMTLSFISRLALLEKADRTRSAIDDLVSVLRYMEDAGETISTLSAEMKVLEKMFALNKEKKGPAFRYIINSDMTEDRCYLPKGILVTVAETAMNKPVDRHREFLEIIVSVAVREHQVVVLIKDNGSTDMGEAGKETADLCHELLAGYSEEQVGIHAEVKPGIGTVVEMIFSA